jgi:hypothetical protein
MKRQERTRMKYFGLKRFGLSLAAVAALFCASPSLTFAQADEQQLAITQAASSVDVTVYGEGFGQVEELRQVKLTAGKNRIQLNGIAAKYRQDSLSIINTSGPGEFKFKSATYQPANLTAERVLELSVGKQVTATVGSGASARQVTGTLVSVRGGQVIITAGDTTHVASSGDIQLGKLAEGLSNSASLVIEADVTTAGTYTLNYLYETDGLGWNAKHTLVYNEDKKIVESFRTTVNVVNGSGTSFDNANLWLLSGSVRQAPGGGRFRAAAAEYAAAPMAADSAAVESVGERKVFRIPGKVSIGDGQSRQLPLYTGSNVVVEHEYYVPAAQYYGEPSNGFTSVNVRLKLKNCAEHNLGTPLPGGAVKVLQRNSEGKLQLTANASIREVAKDELFEIGIGTSSDVKFERVLARANAVAPQPNPIRVRPGQPQPVAPEYQDQDFEVKIHNFKDKKAVDVLVEVAVPAEQDNLAPLTRKSATTATATVHVEAGKEQSLKYTLRIRTN